MRRVAAGLVAAAIAVLLWPGSAVHADPPDQTGWWWKPQVTPLVPVPKPPSVPAGGLYVAADPSGPFGVAAVRYVAAKGSTVSRLTLRIASSQGLVALRACPVEVVWASEEGGPITSVPPHDCMAGAVPGALDPTGTSVAFEVGPLVQDGVLNVLLAPTASPAAFQVAFDKPGDDAVAVSSESSTTETTTMPAPEYSYLEGPAFSDTGPVFGGEAMTGPVAPAEAGPAATPPTTAAPATPRRVFRPQPVSKATRDPDRVVAALVLVALAGAFMWVAERPARLPRMVGPMAVLSGRGGRPVRHATSPVVARGIGRFRRPRTGPAPPL